MKRFRNLLLLILLFSSRAALSQNIFRTACRGNLSALDSLLQYNPVNIQDNRGRSLLHWAIACKKSEVFDFLIDREINPNIEDREHKTPMYLAVRFENEYAFDKLQKLLPDDAWVQSYGMDLLERAVLIKSKLFVEKLIHLGVDVNRRNERGSTALEIAKRIAAPEIYHLLLSLGADERKIRSITMHGKYMGQEAPGRVPKIFAPNFISTEESEFGSVFNSDGTEFYYGVDVNGKNEIRYSKMIENQWSQAKTIFSHPQYGYNDPFLSNDENRLYFISNRALDGLGKPKDIDIWYANRTENGWSEPVNAGTQINTTGNEYYISFSAKGALYFASNGQNAGKKDHDIYYSTNLDHVYQKPLPLGDQINTKEYEADVFVSPDESYMIFCSTRKDGFGRGDLYISFKDSGGKWTKALNMGDTINTKHYEYCPFVTKDGKYLFYTSKQDIYWVSTEVIREMKNQDK